MRLKLKAPSPRCRAGFSFSWLRPLLLTRRVHPFFSRHISVDSDITDAHDNNDWILFDAQCRLCSASAQRLQPLLNRNGFKLVPLQTPWVREKLAVTEEELLHEVRLLSSSGRVFGGVDALIEIAGNIWWARPLSWVAKLPLPRPLLSKAYRCLAKHRYCIAGKCSAPFKSKPK